MEAALWALRPVWLRHCLRRVLFGALPRRVQAATRVARGGAQARPGRFFPAWAGLAVFHDAPCAPPVQSPSVAAWNDEQHVRENRRLYAAKFREVAPLIGAPLQVSLPEAD